jgi:hypothetical protein
VAIMAPVTQYAQKQKDLKRPGKPGPKPKPASKPANTVLTMPDKVTGK